MAFAAKGPGCVLMGLVVHAPFLGPGFGSACSALLGQTHGAGRRWFCRPGCACALFGPGFGSACSALWGRTHRAGRWRFCRPGCVSFLALSLACSALWGRAHGAGRWRFNGPGLRVYPFARRLVRLALRFLGRAHGAVGGFAGRGCRLWQKVFPRRENKNRQPAAKLLQGTPCFPAQTPAFSPLDLLYPCLPSAFCKKKTDPRRKSAEVFDFTMADRLLGRRQWANLASSKRQIHIPSV